jgi:hypothetical protein
MALRSLGLVLVLLGRDSDSSDAKRREAEKSTKTAHLFLVMGPGYIEYYIRPIDCLVLIQSSRALHCIALPNI